MFVTMCETLCVFRCTPTCTGHHGGNSSPGAGSLVVCLSPHMNMMGRWFSSSSLHTMSQCRSRKAHQSCTLQVHALEICAAPGGTSVCCSDLSLLLAWCTPAHILHEGRHTSRTAHSPEPPLNTGSVRLLETRTLR